MSLSFWNQRRRNAAAIMRMKAETEKAEIEKAEIVEEEKAEKPQTKRGKKNVDSGADNGA